MFTSHVDGHYSMIQPCYISQLTNDIQAGQLEHATLSGNFKFQAPNLYAGKVLFRVQVKPDADLQVTEFTLPNYGISVVRNDDGVWPRK